jgi:hypothetical protein
MADCDKKLLISSYRKNPFIMGYKLTIKDGRKFFILSSIYRPPRRVISIKTGSASTTKAPTSFKVSSISSLDWSRLAAGLEPTDFRP